MKFIFGQEEFLAEKAIKNHIKKVGLEPQIFSELDSLTKILMEINTFSLFGEDKLVIIHNHPVLYNPQIALLFLEDLKDFKFEGVEVVFVATQKILRSNPLIAFLLKNADVKELKPIMPKQIPAFIREIVAEKKATITNSAIIKLSYKLPINMRVIVNEIDKLILEKNDITDDQVSLSVENYKTEDYFAFSNAIVNQDVPQIMYLYKEKKILGEQPTTIISQISSVLNLAVMLSFYKKQGFSLGQIAAKTKIHIFRIKKTNSLLSKIDEKILEELIISLAELDFKIKTGQTDSHKGMDNFLLFMIK